MGQNKNKNWKNLSKTIDKPINSLLLTLELQNVDKHTENAWTILLFKIKYIQEKYLFLRNVVHTKGKFYI